MKIDEIRSPRKAAHYYTYIINRGDITRAGADTADKIIRHINPDTPCNITLVAAYDNFNAAMKHAVSLGYELLPTRAVVCNETGDYFANAAAAVKYAETTTAVMSKHLNRKPMFNTIKGRTYRYVNKI